MSPITRSEIGAAQESDALSGQLPVRLSGPHWGWGADGRVWACRISQALGLIAVLAFLLALAAGPLP